jgi:ribosomal protein L35AE/L33A
MATRIFDSKTWRDIGQPDLGSRMFFKDRKTGKKIWGTVVSVEFGHKLGVKLKIKKT